MPFHIIEAEKKFVFETEFQISSSKKTYSNVNESRTSPLASKIFGFPWVAEITVAPVSVTVIRQDWVNWDILAQPLNDMIERHFQNLDPNSIEENPEPAPPAAPQTQKIPEELQKYAQFIQTSINPNLASHGGSVELVGFKEGVLSLVMKGGCQGCGQAQMTLKQGIETSFKAEFAEITEIRDETNHAGGVNPYYS